MMHRLFNNRFVVTVRKTGFPSALNFLSIILLFLIPHFACAEALPTTAPSGIEANLWERMKATDVKSAKINDLTADFEQLKYTALLKKPLKSTGDVHARGNVMLWNTQGKQPTQMRVDEKEVRIYYVNQKTIESYPVAGQLGSLAANPLPRLSTMLNYFQFAVAAENEFEKSDADRLILKLTPTDESLKEHVKSVHVSIDTTTGLMQAFQLTDADGDRQVIHFSNMKTNTDFDDSKLQLQAPADVKVVYPLKDMGAAPKAQK